MAWVFAYGLRTVLSIATWTPEWIMIFLFMYSRSDEVQELKGQFRN
jgi:hypothetical protein